LRKSQVLAPAVLLSCALVSLVPAICFAQEGVNPTRLNAMILAPEANAAASPSLPAAPAAAPASIEPSSRRIGVGVKIGSLGVGGEVAVRVLHRANVRFGFSGLSLGYNFNRDQINYGAKVRMEGAQATFDYFLIGGFRISPGALLYNGTQITGTASVISGSTFTLNSVTYESSSTNPVTGSLGVTFRKAAPVLLFGLGNLIPRGSRRWSISSDFGVAFAGSPSAKLNLTGLACPPGITSGPTCLDVAADPTIHSNVIAEQASVNDKVKFFKIYPVISIGFGYSF
jgi:hypothetical protein